jgi:RNA polymerase sigma-70 factor, ECF subfamily
LFATGAS